MSDIKALLEHADQTVADVPLPAGGLEAIERRRDRKHRNQRTRAGVLAIAIAIAVGWLGINEIRSAPVPADPPPVDLGIFAPAAGRIVYVDGDGLWAVDPDAPSDTVEGPSVADDVASALVRLGPADKFPLGWSSDGTELLLMRPTRHNPLLPRQTLFILHADGSETRLNEDPLGIVGATISPDGTRVVFAGNYNAPSGMYVIDAEGDRPVPLPIPQAEEGVGWPTFSPDGTQIAYLAGNDGTDVWVADADGSNAHEILANITPPSVPCSPGSLARCGGPGQGLQWSPAGDRFAIQVPTGLGGESDIYTFAVDGSDLTQVVTGAYSPYWSPDGSQIAFNIRCDDYRLEPSCAAGAYRPGERIRFGLAIADADGSNVRAFGFAASGPWHPGE